MPKDKGKQAADADAKKKKRRAPQPRQKGRMKEYFKGVKIETKKVVWPTRREIVSYTVVVLITCAFFGLLIWGVDSAFLLGLEKLLGIEIG
jgi:preprotein translocase subunit SecE